MRLARALRLSPGRMVSFTGAGGKSSSLRRLIRERAADEYILLSCTTRLAYVQRDLAAHHLVVQARQELERVPTLLKEHGSLLLTGPGDEEVGKLAGLAPEWVDQAHGLTAQIGGMTAVEGDGARNRWLKAPEEHEPVVPASTDVLAPVVNLAALGRSLDDEIAHRVERVQAVLELELGAVLGAADLVRLLTAADGGLKGRPGGAEVRPLLTGEAQQRQIEAIAAGLLESSEVRAAVHIPDAAGELPLRCFGRIAAVVLAAGGSSRMGELKQVMPWRGKPLVLHATAAAREGGLSPLVVVTGAGADRVEQVLAQESIDFVHNPDWKAGQSSSLKRGLEAVRHQSEAIVFLLADMPDVEADLVAALRRQHASSLAPIVVPVAGGRRGNPVLFDRVTFDDLARVKGDQGGRALYDQYRAAEVPADEGALLDLDIPADLNRLDENAGSDPVR